MRPYGFTGIGKFFAVFARGGILRCVSLRGVKLRRTPTRSKKWLLFPKIGKAKSGEPRQCFHMKRIISSSEIIGLFTRDDHEFEVCATGEANFDEGKSQLIVELDSFIRPVDLRAKEAHLAVAWLPRKQTLKESVSPDETVDLAKDIFHRWVGKVRQSVPSPIHT